MEYRLIKTDYLEMVSGGDKNIIAELVEIFTNQIPEFLELMQSAVDSGNFQELKLIAHKSKSSVAIIGMENQAKRLKELEEMIMAGDTSQVQVVVDEFRDNTAIAIGELENYLSRL